MSVPAADLLINAPVPGPPAEAAAPQARGWRRSLEITIPGAILFLLLFFCFIWPLVYPVPAPVGV